MQVRERIIEAAEASFLARPIDAMGGVVLRELMERTVEHGGLTIAYPNGMIQGYGDEAPELAIRFKSARPILRMTVDPTLALGEGYMKGEVEFEDPTDPDAPPPIDLLADLMNKNGFFDLDKRFGRAADRLRPRTQPNRLRFHKEQVQQHYDIGNEFYSLFLDDTMTYSCAYWDDAPESMSLEQAQQAKLDLIERKLRLEEGHTVLDIGSGWGHLLIDAAKKYGITGLGITLSEEQLKKSRELAETEGVDDDVRFELMDIAELAADPNFKKYFDRVVSVGMYEHMGEDGQEGYFEAVNHLLKVGGVTVLHAISQQRDKPPASWLRKYIFPGGYLHPIDSVSRVAAQYGFRDQQTESLRQHYALTLDQWLSRFEVNLDKVRELYVGGKINHPLIETGEIGDVEEFIRMWRFYLATSSGGFRYGHLNLVQYEWTKGIDPTAPLTRRAIYAPKAA